MEATERERQRIGIVGLGHVGLPTAATLAHLGHEVIGTDVDRERVALLDRGEMPFYEPELEGLVHEGLDQGSLSFSTDPAAVIQGALAVFLCVGTPPRATGGANLLALERSARVVAEHATETLVVVEKSTVPVGTADRIVETLARSNPETRFLLVCNPEFLREGSAVEDSLRPPRLLMGSDSQEALDVMRHVYQSLIDAGTPYIETDLRTAEIAKHACNAFLALKISFANSLARICELSAADVDEVTAIMGSDPRIGPSHLSAGLGYGGSCFPKDLVAFRGMVSRLGYDLPLLDEVARINEEAIDAAYAKVEGVLWHLDDKRIALLGLAFKPDTDDVRFAPALALAGKLVDGGAEVTGYDPRVGRAAEDDLPALRVAETAYDALQGAHCAVLCTEWPEFRDLDFVKIRESMALPVIVDGRNFLDGGALSAVGFDYLPTGKSPLRAERS
jgi:UDPglucose 6-dehydrogenase